MLAREIAAGFDGKTRLFDLESDRDMQLLREPEAILMSLRGLVVIDEVQRQPELFPPLRPLVDRKPLPARFLLRGGYPRSFLARSDAASLEWRDSFLRTYLERDVLSADMRMPPAELRRFWQMLTHWHAQRWNAAEFARAFGVSESTVRRWLEALEGLFAIRLLRPWAASIAKRQVKAPKVFIRDCGLLHALLGTGSLDDLRAHPQVGASFEGFAIEQIIHATGARMSECFHWATYQGAKIDLMIVRGKRRIGFEVKCTEAPMVTESMRIARKQLKLDRVYIVNQGEDRFELRPGIESLPISRLADVSRVLRG